MTGICEICCEDEDIELKLLPCNHKICVECLRRLEHVNEESCECPFCRKIFDIPEGGFVHLPDADSNLTAASCSDVQLATNTPSNAGSSNVQSHTVQYPLHKAKITLKLAEEKFGRCSLLQVELRRQQENLEECIEGQRNEAIPDVDNQIARKKAAIEQMTDQKSNLHAHRESQLKSGFVKLKEHLKKIETCIERPDRHLYEQKMATKFKKLQKYTEELEKLLSPTGECFKAGDSVTLSINTDDLIPDFLRTDLTHSSVGYIHRYDMSQEQCEVIFDKHSFWIGQTCQLEKSGSPHDLPKFLDKVVIKIYTGESPHYGWQGVSPGSVGILTQFLDEKVGNQRVVEVHFGDNLQWRGLFNELEISPLERLKKGDKVSVRLDVIDPEGGWNNITHADEGKLLSIKGQNGDKAVVNFPNCHRWKGWLSELEKVRPITVGDLVQVFVADDKAPKTDDPSDNSAELVEGFITAVHYNADNEASATILSLCPVPCLTLECAFPGILLISRYCREFKYYLDILGYQGGIPGANPEQTQQMASFMEMFLHLGALALNLESADNVEDEAPNLSLPAAASQLIDNGEQ